jgi:carotenoid cleavage dioxygenase-like enzyme
VYLPADERPDGTGWLLTFVYQPVRDASDLIVLDAADLTAAPVARIHLPRRVPYGFHGTRISGDARHRFSSPHRLSQPCQ